MLDADFVCLDFGGTLLDFVPLHVDGFLEALGLSTADPKAAIVERTVMEAVAHGFDSFGMADALAAALDGDLSFERDGLVTDKRTVVERKLRSARLGTEALWFLGEVAAVTRLAVISLGLASSMREVLGRAPRGAIAELPVYGRASLDDRVDKGKLLRQALDDAWIPGRAAVYVGDADVDERVSVEAGVGFLRLCPFSS